MNGQKKIGKLKIKIFGIYGKENNNTKPLDFYLGSETNDGLTGE